MILPSTRTLSFLAASTSLFAIVSAADGDWTSNWSGPERILENSFDVDPNDPRAMMRGSGQITLGNDIAKFKGSPRLYISKDADGWGDVEITAYGKYVAQGTAPFKSYSGLTLVTRSNHHIYADEPCEAFGYYARIYQESGECAFQKEYYHSTTTGTVYTKTKRVPCFEGGLPLDKWVGMKFQVMTVPGTSDVTLELYLDENDDGNWVLSHSVTDTPGFWESNTSTTVPSECPQNDGDTVIRPGGVSFLRTDGVDENTEVHWRDVSMVNMFTGTSGPTSSPRPTASPITLAPVSNSDPTCSTGIEGGNDACCPATCGTCGGSGCGDLPGGSSNCCTGSISTSGRSCNDFLPPCIMGTVVTSQPTSMPTSPLTNVPPTDSPTQKPTTSSPTPYCAGYGVQGNCGNNDSSLCCSSQCQNGKGPNAGKCK